ncbi:Uncharacterised protein [Burkholderia pseudomallei]|uniref:hypothetical protein n=1 Tax=Burkholderia pseudomallei TaxID=28450 RepID=UPI000F14880B|nr:hypothetical protein [Burkholderia pseudomallei]VBW55468.1 Uncharacterised protein [Burkholderia pseudomallei]
MDEVEATIHGVQPKLEPSQGIESNGQQAGPDFYEVDSSQPLYAGKALSGLTDLYIETALKRNFSLALVWPGNLDCLPLLHTLACFKLWASGEFRSLRGLYYPGKRNSLYPLNKFFIGRTWLGNLASDMFIRDATNDGQTYADAVKTKAVVLLAVKSMGAELQEAEIRPCINELMPHFSLESDGEVFEDYLPRFYQRIKVKIADHAHKRALKKTTIPDISSPANAPDGLFTLGHSLTPEALDKALRDMKKLGVPSIVVLDATWKAVRTMPDWRHRFFDFVGKVTRIFGDRAPGFLFVTDEPRQMALFRAMLTNAETGCVDRQALEIHGFVEKDSGIGLKADDAPTAEAASGHLSVRVTDHEVGGLLDALYAEYSRLTKESAGASVINDALVYLARLSHLPGSVRAMWGYLNRIEIDATARNRFDWNYYRRRVQEFLDGGQAKASRKTIEELLERCDVVVAAYESQTPLGMCILNELNAIGKGGGRVGIVVRRVLHKEILANFLEEKGANSAIVDILMVDELTGRTGSLPHAWLIFTDISSVILRAIVTDTGLPRQQTLVLPTPAAKQLRYTLLPLFELEVFDRFFGRLRQLLDPLEQQLQSSPESLWSRDRAWYPTFKLNFEAAEDRYDGPDSDAILIGLEDGQLLRRGLTATTYLYDPLRAADHELGFKRIEARDVRVGDAIFVWSEELREAVEQLFIDNGGRSNSSKVFEEDLREYHARVSAQLDKRFHAKQGGRAGQLRLLKETIERIAPEVRAESANVGYWVNLESLTGKTFEEITTHAPQSFSAFKAFCRALDIDEAEARVHWNLIRDTRNARRRDGKWVSNVYARLLFDEAETMAYSGISPDAIRALRRRATDNVFTVTDVFVMPGEEK